MFKRVEKRRRKREEEEKLGLDEDTRAILGMHDTDSDESDSSSDEDSDSASAQGSSSEGGRDEDDDDDNASEELDDVGDGEAPMIMTVSEAVREPIYAVSVDPDIRRCIVCPGKLLKDPQTTEAHRHSRAHARRFEHFTTAARKANPDDDASIIVARIDVKEPFVATADNNPSNRQVKRLARQAAIKLKRDRHKAAKAKARARKAGDKAEVQESEDSPKIDEPAKKKRRRAEGETHPVPVGRNVKTTETTLPGTKKKKSHNRKLS